jgi:nucleoid DNA-binding protein
MEVCFHLLDQLLAKHNCVVIPDFGGFIGSYRPARLCVSDGQVAPPGKELAFNPRLLRQDGLLVDALASREGIGYTEAESRVQAFAGHCKKELQNQRLLRLPGIGKLLLEDGDKIRFAPLASNDHWPDGFGLPVLELAPQLRSRKATEAAILEKREHSETVPTAPEPVVMDRWSPRRWGWAAAVLLALVGTWQILVVTSTLPHSMAFLYPGHARPVVIEEGKAAVLHPLIPSLSRQMERYGNTTPLSAVGPTAIASDGAETVVLAPNDRTLTDNPAPEDPPIENSSLAANATNNTPTAAERVAADLDEEDAKAGSNAMLERTDWYQPSMQGDVERPPERGYYVVIGSYRQASMALNRIQRCASLPGPSAVLRAPNGNHRAAVFLGTDKAEASAQLDALREAFQQKDAWLLRF